MPEEKTLELPHKLLLDSRTRLSMTGVVEVESFDEQTILLTTSRGPMTIRGRQLHLQQLSLSGGEVLIEGTVDALLYEDEAPAGGLLARLFG